MGKPPPNDIDVTTFSNSIRLNGREWLLVGLFAACLTLLPSFWKHWEKLPPYDRMPHDLSNDYWLFERYAEIAAGQYDTLLLGDSVIWGEYVTGADTLSSFLNRLSGQERYANLGLDGAHPLALEGLVTHYASAVAATNVVLHCNPLWLSSPRADLQDDSVTDFNHPRLVPQFLPQIPSYKVQISDRIGVVVEQHLPLSSWTTHLQQAYYERSDIPSWTLDHPFANPLAQLSQGLPPPKHTLRHAPLPWFKVIKNKQDYPWVDLDSSLQWQAFQRVVAILQKRGNRVFVLVGPFNEHLLTEPSLQRYKEIKAGITAWLTAQQVQHADLPALPSEQYGDASHPLAGGYARLAGELLNASFFGAGSGKSPQIKR